jgi:hypothetical protein
MEICDETVAIAAVGGRYRRSPCCRGPLSDDRAAGTVRTPTSFGVDIAIYVLIFALFASMLLGAVAV